MPAPSPCRRPLSFRSPRRRVGLAVATFLTLGLGLPAGAAVAQPATATAANPAHAVHHPHHVVHGHHPAHHPLHPKIAVPNKPVPVPVPLPHPPAPPVPAPVGSNTGLPLPRFAALRADEVNMRSGPGTRYPILWLYKRRDLPVRIEREFDVWRLVEDDDGVKGWVHQATLVGTRTFIVTASGPVSASATDHGNGTLLRDDPRDDARIVAILRPGVIGRIRACPASSGWCRVSTRSYSGWLLRSAIFGLLPNEAITPP